MTEFAFTWELSGSGWATYRIADGSSEHVGVAGYCTDALADLLHGVAALYGPGSVHRFSFDLEPAELRWVLRGQGPVVDIALYRFPDVSGGFDASDADGTLVWRSRQDRGVLSHAVIEAARSVWRVHGEEGYRTKWVQHPFPVAALRGLCRVHLRDDVCGIRHDLVLP